MSAAPRAGVPSGEEPSPVPGSPQASALADVVAPTARPDALAAFRHANFAWFLAGSFISNVGNHMRTTAVGWEIYQRTGSKLHLGYVGLVMAAPVLLLALPAGAAADRHSRKLLLIIAQLGMAACGVALAWAATVHPPLVWNYGLLLATGMFRALGWPAAVAMVTGLVPAATFPNATMWRSVSFQAAATIGPLAAALLLARHSPAVVYLLDATTSLILVGFLLRVRPAPHPRTTKLRTGRALAEGAAFVRGQPLILSAITLDMVAVLFGGATALLPVYAVDVLKVGPTGFGWLRAMPSLGAIAMGLYLATQPPIARAGRALLAAVAAFGAATIVFGASHSFALSLAAMFVVGAADAISVVIRSTLVQVLTPDAMRGRVAAINAVFINTSNELGEFESGMAAHWFGATLAVVGGGAMTLLTVAATALAWPQLRRLGRIDELRP